MDGENIDKKRWVMGQIREGGLDHWAEEIDFYPDDSGSHRRTSDRDNSEAQWRD